MPVSLPKFLHTRDQVQAVDTSSVAPTPYILPLTNVLAHDTAHACLAPEEAIANAPQAEDGYFRVTAVFE